MKQGSNSSVREDSGRKGSARIGGTGPRGRGPRAEPPRGGLILAAAILAFSFTGCGGSSREGVGITNVNQSAPRLEERDENGNYKPYYASGDMQRPRYLHRGIYTAAGFVVVMGGSDERGLTSLDNVEFFDQATFNDDQPRPESRTGLWFDTNFEGDPMTFETGPRIYFTLDELADGELIAIGGTSNIITGPALAKAEIFNVSTREFDALEEEMQEPRFRHSTLKLNDGQLLVTGGQASALVTVIEETVLGQTQMQIAVFPSLGDVELFSPTEGSFLPFTSEDTGRPVAMNTPRGRAGHATARIAGPDRRLNSADDLYLFGGGYQTLSPQFAPTAKLPGVVGAGEADALRSLEFFDPQTNVFTQVGNVSLGSPRIDSPHIMNLGRFNDFTIDGVPGMGNAVLVLGGNDDQIPCPETFRNVASEVLVASFTGFGPAQGLQFFHIQDVENASHIEGVEYSSNLSPTGAVFQPTVLGFPGGEWVGRAQTNPVSLPRRIVTVDGVSDIATWVFFLAGAHSFDVNIIGQGQQGCTYFHESLVMDAGSVFDPFYSLRAAALGTSTRALSNTRSISNPLGIVGTWLVLDGDIPTVDTSLLGTTPTGSWGAKIAPGRVYPVNLAIPGEDGIINSPDDRILMSGGGSDGQFQGEEPSAPSTEILLPPNVNERAPVN